MVVSGDKMGARGCASAGIGDGVGMGGLGGGLGGMKQNNGSVLTVRISIRHEWHARCF